MNLIDGETCSVADQAKNIISSDADVIKTLNRVFAKESMILDKTAFLKHPEILSEVYLHELPTLQSEYFDDILKLIENPPSPRHKHVLTRYLNKNINFSHIDALMNVFDIKEAHDWIILLLEDLFRTETPHQTDQQQKTYWLNKWKENNKDPQKLGESLWLEHSEILKSKPRLDAAEVSVLSNSPFFETSNAKIVLPLLQKIEPKKQLLRINFSKPLLVKEALPYFNDIPFSEGYLKNFPSYFEISERYMLLDFLINKSQSLDQGVIFNDLVNQKWFLDALESNKIEKTTIDQLIEILNIYYDESSWLAEEEEVNIEVNLFNLENSGRSLFEKLQASITTNISMQAKSVLQMNLLSRLRFEDLPEALKIWPQYSKTPELMAYNFVNQDFGIPFFDYENEKARNELIKQLENKQPIEVYQKYLTDFGIHFQKEDGSPDIPAIISIFKNDLNLPFSGSGGVVRDLYVFSIIKYLELYYQKDLGFHPKLNENQNFYQFNSRKRINAWLQEFENLTERK